MRIAQAILMCIVMNAEFFAQTSEAPQIQIGDRVRITSSKLEYVRVYGETREINIKGVGTLVAMDSDTVSILPEHKKATIKFLRSEISKLEISIGKKSDIARYTVGGLVSGVVIGGIIGYMSYSDTGSEDLFSSRGQSTLTGATLFGATGLLIGVLSSGATSHDRWVEAKF